MPDSGACPNAFDLRWLNDLLFACLRVDSPMTCILLEGWREVFTNMLKKNEKL